LYIIDKEIDIEDKTVEYMNSILKETIVEFERSKLHNKSPAAAIKDFLYFVSKK